MLLKYVAKKLMFLHQLKTAGFEAFMKSTPGMIGVGLVLKLL